MRRRKQKGFTLVELLVVISIIGMLMALLFPAVQAARETARQNTCRNNLRNLALAVTQYEKAKREYPGYINELHPARTDMFTRRSWVFVTLPYLERQDLYDAFSSPGLPQYAVGMSTVQMMQELDIVKCPTNPASGVSTMPQSAYACNVGLTDSDSSQTAMPALPPDWSANGVFQDLRQIVGTDPMSGTAVPITRTTEAYVSTGDGTANTIMLGENVDTESWTLNPASGTGSGRLFERRLGIKWTDAGSNNVGPPASAVPPTPMAPSGLTKSPWLINSNVGADAGFSYDEFARPSSLHPNLVNVAFCDTHVRTLSQDIDYLVYCLLMTPRGRDYKTAGSATIPTAPNVFRITPLDEKLVN